MTAPDSESPKTPTPLPPRPPSLTRVQPLPDPLAPVEKEAQEVAPVQFDFVAFQDDKDFRPIEQPADLEVVPLDPTDSSAVESVDSSQQTDVSTIAVPATTVMPDTQTGQSSNPATTAPVEKVSTLPKVPAVSRQDSSPSPKAG